MSKPNPIDFEDDRERIQRGEAPKYTTMADHGLEEPAEPLPAAVPSQQSHFHRLSMVAHEALSRARETIAGLREVDKAPSASVAIEFLVWWFEETSKLEGKLEGKPNAREFRPLTRMGRPRTYGSQTLRPSDIRKLAGVDSVTAERKLR